MKIPEGYINDILSRVDIIDVIDRRVGLKKQGKNYAACCPFHDEKTPSFTAEQTKQMYYCFGCGAGGNAIGFLIDYERVGFRRAVEILADTAGVPFEFNDEPSEPVYYGPTRQQREDNIHDMYMVAIYEAAQDRNEYIQLSDHKAYKLSCNRLKGYDQIMNNHLRG